MAIYVDDLNSIVVLDLFQQKDNVEIVGWRFVDKEGLENMKRQATREDGQLLILSPDNGLAADLSTLPSNLPYGNKDNTKSTENQIPKEEIIQNNKNVGKELVKRKKKLDKSFSLLNYVEKNNPFRQVLSGIYYDPSGWAVASDAHILIASKELYDNKKRGKIVGKDGKSIEKPFPGWKNLFLRKEQSPTSIDYNAIYSAFSKVEDLLFYC